MSADNQPWWNPTPTATPPPRGPAAARTVRLLASALAVAVGVGAASLMMPNRAATTNNPEPSGVASTPQHLVALAAGCGPIYAHTTSVVGGVVPATTKDGHPNTIQYRTRVPMVGPFWPQPAKPKVWAHKDKNRPRPEQLLHNQYNGDIVVHYTDDLPAAQLEELSLLANATGRRYVVSPWDPAVLGPLPGERRIAFATWNASQTCHDYSPYALDTFAANSPTSSAPGHREPAPAMTLNPQ